MTGMVRSRKVGLVEYLCRHLALPNGQRASVPHALVQVGEHRVSAGFLRYGTIGVEVDRYLLLRDVIVLSNADGIFRDPSAIAACSLFPIGYFFLAVFSLRKRRVALLPRQNNSSSRRHPVR